MNRSRQGFGCKAFAFAAAFFAGFMLLGVAHELIPGLHVETLEGSDIACPFCKLAKTLLLPFITFALTAFCAAVIFAAILHQVVFSRPKDITSVPRAPPIMTLL